ncbi:MAG: cell division protein FtsL [Deltaproteobacteria bacterium]|nr:cell division protein FtsL [Deltaproteobacteria bacterium]MBW1873893.1 cell division protein FtsL [Deltaproteobacteria bacterium]MBW2209441.1 cell division protein FtsL [Deltaproteobacteria bacterium]MBW2212856.1 cell division protein FtsL [Deltaproteobacteria bacterium]MBW2549170.1 cell division protein FtsL [Deltaproteobacteria bacterium]
MKGRFLPLWCVAVFATAAAFVVHLSIRFETVRLGYEVSDERGRQRELLQDRRLLSIEAATLRQSGRIETIARGTLQMEVPKPTRIVTMKEKKSRAAAGRVR